MFRPTIAFRPALTWLAALLLSVPGIATAHGLLLDAESDGNTVRGTVYYSNGDLAVRESVELLDLSTPNAAPVSAQTDDDGRFHFPTVANHRYRVSAYGEEGHSVEVELDAKPESRPELIENGAAEGSALWPPPAWAVIGGALLLSLLPPAISRMKRKAGAALKA